MTVLSRLEGKGFVVRDRESRPHLYRAAMSREDHVAELMHEVLGSASDRDAVLARFVGQVTPHDAERLRKLLDA
jgi:predicted transcriptional regulator